MYIVCVCREEGEILTKDILNMILIFRKVAL